MAENITAANGITQEAPQVSQAAPAKDLKPEESGKKYTDADVDEIISKKFAKWQTEQEKKIAEAEKLARMNEAEKANYEKEQLAKELAALKSEKAMADMARVARGMLKEQEIDAPDAVISKLISEDAEATKAAVTAFAGMFKEAVSDAVKKALRGSTPKTGQSSGITKADIEAVKDPIERQRLIKENMHLYVKE